jgi:hypothetical protein
MQHGEEDGAFERKPVLAPTSEPLDNAPAPLSITHNSDLWGCSRKAKILNRKNPL